MRSCLPNGNLSAEQELEIYGEWDHEGTAVIELSHWISDVLVKPIIMWLLPLLRLLLLLLPLLLQLIRSSTKLLGLLLVLLGNNRVSRFSLESRTETWTLLVDPLFEGFPCRGISFWTGNVSRIFGLVKVPNVQRLFQEEHFLSAHFRTEKNIQQLTSF